MKKVSLLAVLALLVSATVAYAVTNTYEVSGSISPSKSGTAKKPTPIGLDFNYKIGEVDDQRPASVAKYAIKFDGLVANTGAVKATCTANKINEAVSNEVCPAASRVGGGFVKATAGPANDPANQSITCNQGLDVYNAGKNKLALWLKGGPNETDPNRQCLIDQAKAIDAKFVRRGSGKNISTSLEFTVPPELISNNGLAIAVREVESNILKKTGKVGKRKKAGFFESVGGCKQGKRAITVTFTDTQGQSQTAQNFAKCS